MNMQEEVFCYHCKKTFYVDGFRYTNAKTVSCLYCGKRIDKNKSKRGEEQMKCCECGESNANYKCCLCGAMWCEECAETGGYQCECEPITLELIKSKQGKKI